MSLVHKNRAPERARFDFVMLRGYVRSYIPRTRLPNLARRLLIA